MKPFFPLLFFVFASVSCEEQLVLAQKVWKGGEKEVERLQTELDGLNDRIDAREAKFEAYQMKYPVR